jgi:hypothetical protein
MKAAIMKARVMKPMKGAVGIIFMVTVCVRVADGITHMLIGGQIKAAATASGWEMVSAHHPLIAYHDRCTLSSA